MHFKQYIVPYHKVIQNLAVMANVSLDINYTSEQVCFGFNLILCYSVICFVCYVYVLLFVLRFAC